MKATSDMSPLLRRIVPPIAAIGAILLFGNLGFWQLDRAAEKEALEALFEDDAAAVSLRDLRDPFPFRRLQVEGRFLAERQVLVDNIVKNGQLGYYVITPLEYSRSAALLLVNRGFVERKTLETDAGILGVGDERGAVLGRIGRLPRVGVRGGAGFADSGAEWPRVAVYPTSDEVAGQLEREVLPWILLLDPADERGFYRDWRPHQSGPMTHYGYAFQWFAMAATVIVIVGWQIRRRLSS